MRNGTANLLHPQSRLSRPEKFFDECYVSGALAEKIPPTSELVQMLTRSLEDPVVKKSIKATIAQISASK